LFNHLALRPFNFVTARREEDMSLEHNKRTAIDSFRLIETGDMTLAERIIAADFINREAEDDADQPDRQLAGVAGFLATAQWLHAAFSDLHFAEEETLGEDDRVVVVTTMIGRHTGDFQGVAPTGKRISQRQIHLFRFRMGQIVEHQAQRDDLGLLLQIGWRPR
jgi:predicted ester cyclase